MPRPSLRMSRWLKWAAIPLALGVSAVVVSQSSYAAFSATTTNPTSNWTSGSVVLTDDDANTALFTATNLKPGSTGTRCIAVTSTGTLASSVKLYGTTPTTTNLFSSQINLSVVQGTGGTSTDCTGFTALASGSSVYSGTLAAFGTSAGSYTTGVPATNAWAPTGTASETRVYQFTYTVNPLAPNSVQSSTASIGFTWEAQNT